MNRSLRLIFSVLFLCIGMCIVGCGDNLQKFDKCGVSFRISDELKLMKYGVSLEKLAFHPGPCSYDEGFAGSTEMEFSLSWFKTSKLTAQDYRLLIENTPLIFQGIPGLRTEIVGLIEIETISGFEVTYANLNITYHGDTQPGISAVWYCSKSGRLFTYTVLHGKPKQEMERFIRSFSCG